MTDSCCMSVVGHLESWMS